ncbi:hypothetical protein DY000_02042175 [Brassica cretica]|uniref:Uncharacterized protein n=1 Tax=Brassica cretica TaxID=69181 RepID=A0ABQ7BQZ8_BRACR|nr:hypothetical protein DY000_02042175 [Brassica cretica]
MCAGNGTRGLRPASDCRGYSLVMRAGSRSRVAPSRVTPRSLLFVTRVETIDTSPRHPPRAGFSMIPLARASGYSTLRHPSRVEVLHSVLLDALTRVRKPALAQPELCSLELELTSFSVSS